MRIGIDFDNTIICYNGLFAQAARERGWLGGEAQSWRKHAVRSAVRAMPDGELCWQQLQADVYAHRIAQATVMPGVMTFLQRAAEQGHDLWIVSHKSRFAKRDPAKLDLREAALNWLQSQGLFAPQQTGLSPGQVYFESTRAEKLQRITQLKLDCFIDDLEEVLGDPAFPTGVEAILFAPEGRKSNGPYTLMTHWQQISQLLLAPERD
uniref:Haloacid dehalogenase-like hydrolase n=1 Tax=Magnetococcus massalia (strain MO-1) TaxID=451514 RepID=A0A1S7LDA7_MAGMO|nr:Conserved protein of unknown function [Candidatus Magnetococcus massalia]